MLVCKSAKYTLHHFQTKQTIIRWVIDCLITHYAEVRIIRSHIQRYLRLSFASTYRYNTYDHLYRFDFMVFMSSSGYALILKHDLLVFNMVQANRAHLQIELWEQNKTIYNSFFVENAFDKLDFILIMESHKQSHHYFALFVFWVDKGIGKLNRIFIASLFIFSNLP